MKSVLLVFKLSVIFGSTSSPHFYSAFHPLDCTYTFTDAFLLDLFLFVLCHLKTVIAHLLLLDYGFGLDLRIGLRLCSPGLSQMLTLLCKIVDRE